MPGAAGGPARGTSKTTLRILKTSWPGSAGTWKSHGSRVLRPGRPRAGEPGRGEVTRHLRRPERPGATGVLPPAGTGPRRTRQMSAINALLDESADFRTAQDLHRLLCARGEKAGRATVYRTLHALVRAGELDMARSARGEMLYRRCGPGHHHHLICRRCGRVVEITSPSLGQWIAQIAARNGYRDIEHELEVTGICPGCAQSPHAG